VKPPVKLDLKCDQNELIAFLQRKKIKFELIDFAFLLALVLMDAPLGGPIFGSKIPDDLIKEIRKHLRKAEKMGLSLEQVDPSRSLRSAVLKGRQRGQPVKKKYAIVYLWAPLVKRGDEVPWSLLARLRRWFYERLEGKDYREKIRARIKIKNMSKGLKKKCMIKNETIEEYLYGSRRPDWKDKSIETLVEYLRLCIFKGPQRKFFPRAVNFAGDSIEVEADFKDGGESKTVRMKRDFKTQEFTQALLGPSDGRDFGSVTFSN
jgi:hypothetical protein